MRPRFKSITVILSPYHTGIPEVAVGGGPSFLKQHGIIDTIRNQGVSVREVLLPPVHDQFDGEITRSFEIMRRTSMLVHQAQEAKSFPIVLAGNCSSAVGVHAGMSDAVRRMGGTPSCIWFDAHDDFNTPDTMMSGYFDSMPIAMLGNLCFKAMLGTIPGFRPLDLKRLIHVGMRDVNELERNHVREAGLAVVWGDENSKVDFDVGLEAMIEKINLAAQTSMIHFDLDSLDTSIGKANKFAAPGGLTEDDIVRCLRRTAETTQPMALTLASFDPHFEGAESIAKVAIQAVSSFVQVLIEKGVISN